MTRAIGVVLAGCALLALGACTSSSTAGPQGPPGGSSALSSASAPAAPSTSASTSSAASLSPYEADPGVKAYRAWAAEAARTINTGHYTSSALRQLMTPAFAKQMKPILGTEVGRYYPGPIPFTPVDLVVPASTVHQSTGCLESAGFAENPKTHKPAAARKILPVTVTTVYRNGTWLMNGLTGQAKISCAGVRIGAPRW